MLAVQRMNFSEEELKLMSDDASGYVWAVLDVKRGIVAAGNEYVEKMKHALLKRKSSIYDVFGVGFDLETGEIDFCSPANRKVVDRESTGEVPEDKRERVETLIRYFFSELPVFKARRAMRYSRYMM